MTTPSDLRQTAIEAMRAANDALLALSADPAKPGLLARRAERERYAHEVEALRRARESWRKLHSAAERTARTPTPANWQAVAEALRECVKAQAALSRT